MQDLIDIGYRIRKSGYIFGKESHQNRRFEVTLLGRTHQVDSRSHKNVEQVTFLGKILVYNNP